MISPSIAEPLAGGCLVFVDIEVRQSHIRQIAAIAVDAGLAERECFEVKVRPEIPAKRKADKTKPKRRYFWPRTAVAAPDAAKAFADFLRRHTSVGLVSPKHGPYQVAQLVAHNALFDGPFLHAWFERLGVFLPASYRVFCTMQRAFWLFHERPDLVPPADYKLLTLCAYFGVPFSAEEAHDAMADIRATLELYRRIQAFHAPQVGEAIPRRMSA